MGYYHRFKLISHSFFWRWYLKWAYRQGIKDLVKLQRKVDFTKSKFTTLLCGVSGEITADEFIKFVLNKNKQAVIKIIDLGEEQISAVKRLVAAKYANFDIEVNQANALNLDFLDDNSVDWIETDGLLEYFDEVSLTNLLKEWRRILCDDGVITTRDFASSSIWGLLIDAFRIWVGKTYLGVRLYQYTKVKLEYVFTQTYYQFVSGLSPFPTYRRYTLIKKL